MPKTKKSLYNESILIDLKRGLKNVEYLLEENETEEAGNNANDTMRW